jgi:IclR family pca regulon transcriptional regulator
MSLSSDATTSRADSANDAVRTQAPPSKREPTRSRDFVKSLERGLAVIRALGSQPRPMTLREVAEEAGIPRAASRRFLLTLAELSYVETDGRLFRLTPRVMELGYGYLSGLSLPDIALPHIERLVAEVEQPSEGAVLDEDEIVYVFRVPGPHIMTSVLNVGARMPAHATAMGKVLLAYLPDDEFTAYLKRADLRSYTPSTVTDGERLRADIERVRTDGYALVDQELEQGLVAVAVPVHDRQGEVVASINVSSSTVHHSAKSLAQAVLPALQTTAGEIEKDLAATARPNAL